MAEWRRLYKKEWKPGAERVNYVKKKIEAWQCGLVVKLGFMANSTQQLLAGMPNEHEIGEPDLEVWHKKKHVANVEVTGSWINIKDGVLFLRPDKVEWAKQHPVPRSWTWFVYIDNEFVADTVNAGQYPIVEKNLKGRIERYHTIPQADTIPPDILMGFLCKRGKQLRISLQKVGISVYLSFN